jgi:hypothetical protein
MPAYDEERLARLLRTLPPAPDDWVKAAQELPFARLDEIIERAVADEKFRRELEADLEGALTRAGYEPSERLTTALRERLARP